MYCVPACICQVQAAEAGEKCENTQSHAEACMCVRAGALDDRKECEQTDPVCLLVCVGHSARLLGVAAERAASPVLSHSHG